MNLNCTSLSKRLALVAITALAPCAAAFTQVISSVGPGGVIPDGPKDGAPWNTPPYWPALISPVTVPARVDSVTSVVIQGLLHTWRGDVHVYLENPAGERFNVIVRPGFTRGFTIPGGDAGIFLGGTYTLVQAGGASLAQGSADLAGGTYNQYLNTGNGMWTSLTFRIANAPLGLISGSAGTWKLHLRDWFEDGAPGLITGWWLVGESYAGTVSSFCFGDGTGELCPCGPSYNGGPGRGCKNSKPGNIGCLLTAVHSTLGTPNPSVSVTTNELALKAEGMLAGSYAIFLQGTATVNDGLGDSSSPSFDGLECVGGTLVRLGRITTMGGTNTLAGVAGLAGLVGAQTKYYQAVYRNAVDYCTPATLNTSNGLTIGWTP